MVRLKASKFPTPDEPLSIFQFHYGTIKRAGQPSTYRFQTNFNSTMVRLKEDIPSYQQRMRWQFQFHYGTIKSSSWTDMLEEFGVFQFHYGTIKRGRKPA